MQPLFHGCYFGVGEASAPVNQGADSYVAQQLVANMGFEGKLEFALLIAVEKVCCLLVGTAPLLFITADSN